MDANGVNELARQLDPHANWYHHAKALREYASLLASVESGDDEVFRELRVWGNILRANGYTTAPDELKSVAARIVFDAQEKERLRAELASVKAQLRKATKQRDAYWTHAEALYADAKKTHELFKAYGKKSFERGAYTDYDAYRAAHTKEGA